jgi:hypothetical protein
MSWNITVTDVNGCTFDFFNKPIAKDPTPVIDLSIVDKCCRGCFLKFKLVWVPIQLV